MGKDKDKKPTKQSKKEKSSQQTQQEPKIDFTSDYIQKRMQEISK